MNHIIKGSVLLAATLLITACATDVKQCDPNSGDVSLITKFNCQYSGTYQQRIDDRKQALAYESTLNSELKALMSELQLELDKQDAEFNQSKAKNDLANTRLNQLLQNIKNKTVENQALQSQISDIQNLVNEPTEGNSDIEKRLKLEELKSKVSELETNLGLAEG